MRFLQWLNEGDWEDDTPAEPKVRASKQLEGLAEQAIQLLRRLQNICSKFPDSYKIAVYNAVDVNDSRSLFIPFHYCQTPTSLEPMYAVIKPTLLPNEEMRQVHRIASKMKDVFKEQKEAKFKLMSNFGPRGQPGSGPRG